MSNHIKSIVFALVLCLVSSLLLTAASSGLKSFQDKNIALDKHKNILKSVGLLADGEKYAAEYVEKLYTDNIRSLWVGAEGKIIQKKERGENDLPVYLYVKQNNIESYILPIESRGLWGKISGYLAIKNDGTTVSGFTVYHHSETPGLGGEIEKRWFQKNFEGKKILDRAGGFVSISVAKGAVPSEKQPYYVDGISGATLTGKFLSAGLKETLLEYEPVAVQFRKNREMKVGN